MFYKLVNAYTRQFAFPHRGLKYFLRLARWLNIADRTYHKKLPGNFYMRVNPTEHIQQQLFWYGYYEKELGDLICRILKPGGVFLDVGANIGYFSLLAAKRQPASKVIAIEPVKNLFGMLIENIGTNGITNLTAINAAAGDVNEEKEIFLSAPDNWGMSSLKKPENFSGKSEKVTVLSLDSWFSDSDLRGVDLVKIDVEGYELNALRGMAEILKRFKPILIIEINPQTLSMFDITSSEVIGFLDSLNYENFIISGDGILTKLEGEIKIATNIMSIEPQKKAMHRYLFD